LDERRAGEKSHHAIEPFRAADGGRKHRKDIIIWDEEYWWSGLEEAESRLL
jgi:hypothetical protein